MPSKKHRCVLKNIVFTTRHVTGRRAGDSLWEDPDETPRKSLVRLFDGGGGSTPHTHSSDEEPNTEDKDFIKGADEPDTDPTYTPTDEESEWYSGLERPEEESKKTNPVSGGAWMDVKRVPKSLSSTSTHS